MALQGWVDVWLSEVISGWAYDDQSGEPIHLDLEVNGEIVASFLCAEFRADLRDAGLRGGRCGFRFSPRSFLRAGRNCCRLLWHRSKQMPGNGERDVTIPAELAASDRPRLIAPEAVWDGTSDPAFFRQPPTAIGESEFAVHVAGPYNSGTNLLHVLLGLNGVPGSDEEATALLFKHFPVPVLKMLLKRHSLLSRVRRIFLVLVREPESWISAMKSAQYEAEFELIRAPFEIHVEQMISYDRPCREYLDSAYCGEDYRRFFRAADIVEYWNDFYGCWSQFGRELSKDVYFIRYEDLAMHPCECIALIRNLAHMPATDTITVQVSSAKPQHQVSGTLWSARSKLARYQPSLSAEEMEFLRLHLRRDLCEYFRYEFR